jgi:signal transduction histidine kinase
MIKAVTDRTLTENKDKLSADIIDAFRTIDRTNSELARFINDILKVTKMESMSLEPRKEVVDINRVVESAVQRLKFVADEKQIKLILDLEPLFSTEGDEQLIQEVVLNLVENAIKYSPKNKEVIVRTREREDLIQVSILDQGIGIPLEEIPRVTSKFYRGQNTRDSSKGSGLGLYLSKYFVELHRGTLDIKSTLGKGTEVVFTLPIPKR